MKTKTHSSLLFIMIVLISTFPVANADSQMWSVQILDVNSAYLNGGLIAIDSKSDPHIVYSVYNENYPETNILYKSWNGSAWKVETVIIGGIAVDFVLDSKNTPHILYKDTNTGVGLKYATFTGVNWSSQIVDVKGFEGSLALDSIEKPHVAYTDGRDLKYAILTDLNWSIQTLKTAGNIFGPCLAFDSNNKPYILYVEGAYESTEAIRYAVWNENGSWNYQTVVNNARIGHLSLGTDGYPHFTYFEQVHIGNNTLAKLAYKSCHGATWETQIIASDIEPGSRGGNFILDQQNDPHICYFVPSTSSARQGDLIYAKLVDNIWNIQTITNSNATGPGTIAVDTQGNPHISYPGPVNGNYLPTYLMYTTVTPLDQATNSRMPAVISWTIAIIAVIIVIAIIIYAQKRKRKITF